MTPTERTIWSPIERTAEISADDVPAELIRNTPLTYTVAALLNLREGEEIFRKILATQAKQMMRNHLALGLSSAAVVTKHKDHLLRLLLSSSVSVCIGNESEFVALGIDPDDERTLQEFSKRVPIIAITRGGKPTRVVESGIVSDVPPLNVRIVDTTGAGDAFAGGFLASLVEGVSPADSAKLGNRFGAMVAISEGNRLTATVDRRMAEFGLP